MPRQYRLQDKDTPESLATYGTGKASDYQDLILPNIGFQMQRGDKPGTLYPWNPGMWINLPEKWEHVPGEVFDGARKS